MIRCSKYLMLLAAAMLVSLSATAANAGGSHHDKPEPEPCCVGKTILVNEDFEGYSYDKEYKKVNGSWKWVYTDFPHEKPSNDPVRLGIPQIGEGSLGIGAKTTWYAAEINEGGDLLKDVAVQYVGGGSNSTHTGRVGESAAMLLNLSTKDYENVEICFDYRTFRAESGDNLKVYTYVGELASTNGIIDLSESDLDDAGWTKLLSHRGDTWKHFEGTLADCEQSVWVMFWMDGSYDDDYGKFDNILICGDKKPGDGNVVPTPAALPAGLALVAMLASRRRRVA